MIKIPFLIIAIFSAFATTVNAQSMNTSNSDNAQSIVLRSKDQSVRVLEVYSSQGCSSCPPAERWVNSWLDSPDLWNRFIPLVFHLLWWCYWLLLSFCAVAMYELCDYQCIRFTETTIYIYWSSETSNIEVIFTSSTSPLK